MPTTVRHRPPGSLDPEGRKDHLAHAHAPDTNDDADGGAARTEAVGRRSWRHPPRHHPNYRHRPRRRTFTARDKLRILAETDRAAGDRGDRRDPAPRGTLLVDLD